ncbi:MAG: EAL domain-containing protein [Lachnospiraceae bacterium]|nr:EAL domain-containing protein [Lachnospiraceae bacterium]
MKDELKKKYFKEVFEVFASELEGRYPFYADYLSDEIYYSDAAVKALGLQKYYKNSEGALEAYEARIHPDDLKLYHAEAMRMMNGDTDEMLVPYRILNAQNRYVTCSTDATFFRDAQGNPEFFCGIIINHELNNVVDPITGLYTGRTMRQDMEHMVRNNQPFYLMVFGIRDFLSINNRFGYAEGNQILHDVGQKMMDHRQGGRFYSLEGTKFAGLWANEEHMSMRGREIFLSCKEYFKNDFMVHGDHVVIDLYGGAIQTYAEDRDVNAIYTSAMYSLNLAKHMHRSDFYQFDRDELTKNRKSFSLLAQIRESVVRDYDGFFLVYQPIISCRSGRICGMESLIRWQDEKYEVIPPDVFVEWLEKDAVFSDLGRWILRQSMEDAKHFAREIPNFTLNVNLSYPQLEREDFNQMLQEIMEETQFPPEHLRLEITERCRLLDRKVLRERMEFMQSLGIRTSLDDFGTGYSALELMFDLPTNQIKIDRSFITDIATSNSKQIMLKAICECAGEIGASVCVEGVEDIGTIHFIKEHYQVSSMQGFYFSKPLPIAEFYTWCEAYVPEG